MQGFTTRIEALPETFPVFPLPGALLLPHGRLPLNIFEPRYLAMTEDALAAGRLLGMIQPDPRAPEGGPGLFSVGCLGRLSSFSETDDGRYLITLSGVIRFAVMHEVEGRRGYRRVQGNFDAYHQDLAPLPETAPAGRREAILAALRIYFAKRGIEANWDAITRLPEPTLVVTIAMACPFDPVEKQALLEAAGPEERAETLLALLRMADAGPEGSDPHPAS